MSTISFWKNKIFLILFVLSFVFSFGFAENTTVEKTYVVTANRTQTEIHEKTKNKIIQETINNEDITYTNKDTFIENENTNNDTTENNNENFYPVEIAKQITEDIIDRKIIENLFYPEKATRRGIEGKIIIKVEISKNGKLLKYEIISKNNNQILENSAIITINKIFPIEELMQKNSQEDFSTIISFIYKLN